ncbi:hypothetical protein AOCH_003880, partial [Aspergillus ochraceoroseus]
MSSHRITRRRIAVAATFITLFLIYHFSTLGSTVQYPPNVQQNLRDGCPPLPGIEDILTTFRCVPHYIIYSDFEEEIDGVLIHDALRNVDSQVKATVPDFQIYNRLQKSGRAGLESADFADEANSAIGKPNNPGWKLDKWKFLPMAREAYLHRPQAKWFVFMEADTYFSWPTLLTWLARFDASKPWYIGTETQIADVIFAHGGSGFIISNPAMKLVADEYEEHAIELNEYTDAHWAGDCVLGKVLSTVGVPLQYSWPILQNSNIGELDEFTTAFYRRPWCYPAVAFHHLSPSDIQYLNDFEHRRLIQ